MRARSGSAGAKSGEKRAGGSAKNSGPASDLPVLHNIGLALDVMDDPISLHATDGQIVYANKQLLDLYAMPFNEVVGKRCEELFHDRESPCVHEQVLTTGHASEAENCLEIDGRSFKVSIKLLDGGGALFGYLRVMRDVTERERAQEQILKAERFATLGQMVSGIAHDIGTPLNIISGYSEYLLMRTEPEAKGRKELSTIFQQARRVAEFLRQMMDLARPAQGRCDAIGLEGFLTDTLDLLSHHFRKADVKACLNYDVATPVIYGDAPRLRQAMFNLLLNLCQHNTPGSKVDVFVGSSEEDPPRIKIAFSSTDREGKPHDLSEFFRGFLQPDKRVESIGLGLTLTREILTEFGAEASFDDAGPGGALLVVFLPVSLSRPTAGVA